MSVNKLSPNPQKTECMIIGNPLNTRKPELPETLKLNGSEIKRVEKTKYLAIITNENAKIKDNWSRSWLKVENIIRYCRNIMTYKL